MVRISINIMMQRQIHPWRWVFMLALLMASMTSQAQIQVFACEPEWASLVRTLGGEHVDVYSATTNKQDPHFIQARPSLIAKTRRAELLVCTGAELEIGWLPVLLIKSGNASILEGGDGHFLAANYVELDGQQENVDRSHGHVHAAGNPHIHLDPDRLLMVAKQLAKRLGELDSAHVADYQQNLATFTYQWKAKMHEWQNVTSPLQGCGVVVHHDNWLYMLDWMGIKSLAKLEKKPGVPPSSVHLSSLISQLEGQNALGVIYANYQDERASKWLSKKTGLPAVKLSFSPSPEQSLIDWYDQLVHQLVSLNH